MSKANLEIQEGVNFHLFCYCNFLVSTRKLRKETRKLYLRSLIICNARAKQVNSCLQALKQHLLCYSLANNDYSLRQACKECSSREQQVGVSTPTKIKSRALFKEQSPEFARLKSAGLPATAIQSKRPKDVEKRRVFFFFACVSFSLPRN